MNSTNDVLKRINMNYDAAFKIYDSINMGGNVQRTLEEISFLGKFMAIFVTGVYASERLEDRLIEIGRREGMEGCDVPQNNKTLFVMTEASEGGGHTVLTSNYIRWNDDEECSLVFTRMEVDKTPTFVKEAVNASHGSIYYLTGDFVEKAKELNSLSKGYSKIVLLQHPEDIVPDIAYSSLGWKVPIYMYLHANFSFSFGFKIADKVLTLNHYDIDKAIRYRGVDQKRLEYFQFPNDGRLVSNKNDELTDEIDEDYAIAVADKYGIDLSKKIVVTMAEGFKLNDIVGCSFTDFARRLIEDRNNDTQYIVIGPNPTSTTWKRIETDTDGKVKAVGYLKRKDACAIIKKASLYIVSFPMSASGNMIAEAYRVPFLTYALTERGRERQDPRTLTYSIDELINKANDILDGNGEQYLLGERDNIVPQDEWKNQWNDIIESTKEHLIYSIDPKRGIEDEELINCQLMQERAAEEMRYYLGRSLLSIDSLKRFSDISDEYNLDMISKYCTILPEERYTRLSKESILYCYINGWLRAGLAGYSIDFYFRERGISCISIYGAAVMGKNLYLALENTDIEVECFIDRSTSVRRVPAKVIDVSMVPQKSKVIINTAIGNNEFIRAGYKALTDDYEFISIFDIIDEMCVRANI